MRWSLPSLLLSVLLILPAAARGRLEGVASVMDGDTIEIHGARIRLNGIDARRAISYAKDLMDRNGTTVRDLPLPWPPGRLH